MNGQGSASAEAAAGRSRVARPSDEELLLRVANGKVAALEALYDRYGGVLYALAVRVLRDRGAAEEVVQDVFLAAWRKAGSFDPERGRAYGWLVGIARNRAVDELRRHRSPAQMPAAVRLSPEAAPDPGEAEEYESPTTRPGWDAAALESAVRRLPREQHRVLELAYFGGLSQREISESTGVPLGTVKTRTRLALGKLRETLKPAPQPTTEPAIGPVDRKELSRRFFPGVALVGKEMV